MKKYTSKLIILGTLLGVILTPTLVLAQNNLPPQGNAPISSSASVSITQDELKAMLEAESKVSNATNKSLYGTPEEGTIDDSDFVTARSDAMRMCNNLGAKIFSITDGQQSSIWLEPSYKCSTAIVIQGRTPDDVLGKEMPRAYAVSQVTTQLFNFLVTMRSSSKAEPPLTSESYAKIQEQSKQAANTNEVGQFRQFFSTMISVISNIWVGILTGFASLAVLLLKTIVDLTASNQSTPEIVIRGWTIIRDFMNLFFILSLIVMALATILQVESYNYKTLLRQLILMALLINFSKAIADVLIAVSNSLMLVFSPKEGYMVISDILFKNFVTSGDGIAGFLADGQTITESAGSAVTKVIGTVVLTVSLVAISMLLVIRMIGLWFLVMISPAAYALNILPRTKSYAQMWWTTFFKYLIWGPVTLFFFKIAYTFMKENGSNMFANSMLNNLFIAGVLWAGFLVAKGSGMYGAEYAVSAANKGISYAKSGTKTYGNLWWRGTAPGLAGGAIGAGAGFLAANNVTFRERLKAGKEAGKEGFKEVKEAVGNKTAWVENQPKLMKQKWITNPDAERDKLVKKNYRRSMISRNYLKDFDESLAKDLTPEEVEYAMSLPDFNEGKFNNIMDHGKPAAKMALLMAHREGKLQEMFNKDKKTWTDATQLQMKQRLREFGWKESGRALKDLDKHNEFMSDDVSNPVKDANGVVVMEKRVIDGTPQEVPLTYLRRDVVFKPKDAKKFTEAKDLAEQMKHSYQKVDPDRNYTVKVKKEDKLKTKSESGIVITDADKSPKEGTSEERMKRYKDAGNIEKK